MLKKPADTAQPIHNILAERWSGRAFDADKALTAEEITALCEAARWAPSCYGDEPWRFIIWNKFDDAKTWKKVVDCLSPGNQQWAQNAPLLILATSMPNFSHNDSPNRWAGYDTGAASISLCLQATAMGLMTHQMGGYDADKIRQTFNLPEEINLWAMIAVGHPAPLENLDEEQQQRELRARARRPLSEQFFHGGWQGPEQAGE